MHQSFVWMLAASFMVTIALAQAVTYTDVLAQDTPNNITLNFTIVSLDIDSVAIGSGVNLSTTNYTITSANFSFPSINFTTSNTLIYSYQFPNQTVVSSNVRQITSGLSQNVYGQITLLTSGIVPSSPLLVHPDGSSEYPSYLYGSGVMTFTASIQPGTNTLYLSTVPNTPQQVSACSSSNAGFVLGIGFIGLLLVVVLSLGVMMVVSKFRSGENVSGVFDWITDNSTSVVVLSFVLIFGIVIITAVVANC